MQRGENKAPLPGKQSKEEQSELFSCCEHLWENMIESTSEILLGIVVNNTLTWKTQLNRDDENLGL